MFFLSGVKNFYSLKNLFYYKEHVQSKRSKDLKGPSQNRPSLGCPNGCLSIVYLLRCKKKKKGGGYFDRLAFYKEHFIVNVLHRTFKGSPKNRPF